MAAVAPRYRAITTPTRIVMPRSVNTVALVQQSAAEPPETLSTPLALCGPQQTLPFEDTAEQQAFAEGFYDQAFCSLGRRPLGSVDWKEAASLAQVSETDGLMFFLQLLHAELRTLLDLGQRQWSIDLYRHELLLRQQDLAQLIIAIVYDAEMAGSTLKAPERREARNRAVLHALHVDCAAAAGAAEPEGCIPAPGKTNPFFNSGIDNYR